MNEEKPMQTLEVATREANARLIAEAPEMYSIICQISQLISNMPLRLLERAEAVIRRVEGISGR